MVKKILVTTDGSTRAEKAAEFGISLAKACDASINIISVVDAGSPRSALDIDPDEIREIMEQQDIDQLEMEKKKPELVFVSRVTKMAAEEGIGARCEVKIGNPSEEIIDYAKETSADIIVMGSHGRTAIANALMGNIATRVLHNGNIPVLIIPAHDA